MLPAVEVPEDELLLDDELELELLDEDEELFDELELLLEELELLELELELLELELVEEPVPQAAPVTCGVSTGPPLVLP